MAWPPLPDSLRAKGKHANLSSQQVLWQRGQPPSPSASAAVEFRPCTLQPMAPTQGQTTPVRLSMRRHVCNLSGAGVKKCATEDPDEYERAEQTKDISSDYRQKSNNEVWVGDQKHLTVSL